MLWFDEILWKLQWIFSLGIAMIHLKSIAIPREKSHCKFHGKFILHYKIHPCCLFSKPCWNNSCRLNFNKIIKSSNIANCSSNFFFKFRENSIQCISAISTWWTRNKKFVKALLYFDKKLIFSLSSYRKKIIVRIIETANSPNSSPAESDEDEQENNQPSTIW